MSWFDDESNFAKKYRLETQIRATKQGTESIQEFYLVMVGFWNQLARMEPSDLSELSSYKKYREEHRLVQFLVALREEFGSFRESILCRSFLPSVKEAVSELKIEETRLKSPVVYSKGKYSVGNDDEPVLGPLIGLALASFAAVQVSRTVFSYFGDKVEDSHSGVKILSYNVCYREKLEVDERMKALGNLIQLHSPDVICFQEVTSKIYSIFKQSSWWKTYRCSVPYQEANTEPYFCMQLSKLPVESFSSRPFRNSRLGRELCLAEVEGCSGKPLIVATSHLTSPRYENSSEARVAQANEALKLLTNYRNVIFCGDMNWSDKSDGRFPLFCGWVDAWEELRQTEDGWTYDTISNGMLSANYLRVQSRLDRFICKLPDFKLGTIEMIGTEAIPGLFLYASKIPVFPSDHYGLLLEIH